MISSNPCFFPFSDQAAEVSSLSFSRGFSMLLNKRVKKWKKIEFWTILSLDFLKLKSRNGKEVYRYETPDFLIVEMA